MKDDEMVDLHELDNDDGDVDPRLWMGKHLGEVGKEEDVDLGGEEEDVDLGGEDEAVKGKDGFDCMPTNSNNLDRDELRVMGDFLQPLETTQLTLSFQGQLNHQPSIDLIESHNGPSLNNSSTKGKRDNKRMKLEGSPTEEEEDIGDLDACLNQIEKLANKAQRFINMEKDSSMNHEMLLSEVQERDALIDYLHNSTQEETEKRDREINRLNRELFKMADVLEHYKKAVKQSDKAFSEYRQQCQLPEEPIYRDFGTAGLVLSINDIEKRRKKEEEELAQVCELVVQKAKDAEEFYHLHFNDFLDNVNHKIDKLKELESDFKSLKDSYSKHKVLETSLCADVESCATV